VAKAEDKAGPRALWKLDSPFKDMAELGGDNCGSPEDLGSRALIGLAAQDTWEESQNRVAALGLTPPPDPVPTHCAQPVMTHRSGCPPRMEQSCPAIVVLPWGGLEGSGLAPGSLLQLPPPGPTLAWMMEPASSQSSPGICQKQVPQPFTQTLPTLRSSGPTLPCHTSCRHWSGCMSDRASGA
jgi:hypothetical protein